MSDIDCGDNSCMFAKHKGGMRTNGGCRCFENAGFVRSATRSAYQMLPEVLSLRARCAELEAQNAKLSLANQFHREQHEMTSRRENELRAENATLIII